jgi:hypothetical protein
MSPPPQQSAPAGYSGTPTRADAIERLAAGVSPRGRALFAALRALGRLPEDVDRALTAQPSP